MCGLRREEVAYMAGVSVTWYTWLEQGRDVTPSRQVLDALAQSLRLSPAEHCYLLTLAGYSMPPQSDGPLQKVVPDNVLRLLNALDEYPAYVIAADWSMLAWNSAYSALYPRIDTMADADRNLLWLLFNDPYLRELMPDWEFTSAQNVAWFRASAGARINQPPFGTVVDRLLASSPPFRSAWDSHDIGAMSSRERRFRHPTVGDLQFEQHSLESTGHRNIHIVVFTPLQSTDSAARLGQLIASKAQSEL
jgi:transcriptional regulator with XRE-family HTH domain